MQGRVAELYMFAWARVGHNQHFTSCLAMSQGKYLCLWGYSATKMTYSALYLTRAEQEHATLYACHAGEGLQTPGAALGFLLQQYLRPILALRNRLGHTY